MSASLYQKLDAASHEAYGLSKELGQLRKRIEKLETAARNVCSYDYSDCDDDVQMAIRKLAELIDSDRK